nr:MAG TPA: hypothetical protein [Caudoviricetes sp.]
MFAPLSLLNLKSAPLYGAHTWRNYNVCTEKQTETITVRGFPLIKGGS